MCWCDGSWRRIFDLGAGLQPSRRRQEKTPMYPSPNPLPERSRATVAEALEGVLADGLDLHSQIKVAHWNVKGPHFAALHALFESFATALSAHTDAVAERAVTLGAVVRGTARQ